MPKAALIALNILSGVHLAMKHAATRPSSNPALAPANAAAQNCPLLKLTPPVKLKNAPTTPATLPSAMPISTGADELMAMPCALNVPISYEDLLRCAYKM